ncbi:ubiquitin domain-containing protein 7SL RNA1-like [Populus alba]|uniref:ubiquitin domain-containing protein 7SL RNA1-like n=1 Tax=Populus alba TaxID=43335 RepID=UPI00158A728B|nr:ubiquitin domain-containing protein 7SL RNA1-like [Populus alba]
MSFFEPRRGGPLSIEVGFFDTVSEIKEKIHKYHGIPINKQTLVFHGQVLQDDKDVEYCEILQNSRIQLLITPETDPEPQVTVEQTSHSKKVQLRIKIPSNQTLVPLEMDMSDTVLHLKEKIHEIEPVPVKRLVLQSNGAELQDHQSLHECELKCNSEISVYVKPSSPSGSGSKGGSTGFKKLRVIVVTRCGTKKIPVEVNPSDKVGEIRKELQDLQQEYQFLLPQEGYFFIHKQNVMDDDRSFRWHQVKQGDTIDIFNGTVTNGS